jgi:hypothetical protein
MQRVAGKERAMTQAWPVLGVAGDQETFALLHLASQMLGKIRLKRSVWQNHGWHLTLRPYSNGLAILPTGTPDGRSFTLALDLCAHGIALSISDGGHDFIPFAGHSVAALRSELVAVLEQHGLPSDFHGVPNEIPDAVAFAEDRRPRSYSEDSARRLLDAFARVVPIFERFRAGFVGKASPVHFFWGSFDLAVTRFSGRTAPTHPGGVPGLPDRVTREAYSHEVSSAGFWPGGGAATDSAPLFYSYAYPEPVGFRDSPLAVGKFDATLGEFTLPYDAVRSADDPAATLLAFLQSTYDAAAERAGWDRASLEREPVAP